MSPEVAESWIRSREFGVKPDTKLMGHMLAHEEIKNLIAQNRLLIETAVPLLKTFKPLLKLSGYLLCLHSSDGTILHQEAENDVLSSFNNLNNRVGSVWSEETVGTTAHSLCMQLKKPIQLLGPENYSLQLENNISSASPIMDEAGHVIGALVLVQDILGGYPWQKNLQNLQSHTLGWVTSMGVAIESQLKLKIANSTLNATLEFVDEGIISIDYEGKIKHLNKVASRILHLTQDEAIGRNLKTFFKEQPNILSSLTSGKSIEFQETTVNNYRYLVSIKPIFEDGNHINGAVLRLTNAEKINALVNSRVGANAKIEFEGIIGDSDPIVKSKSLGRKYARTCENVLLIGESGTGKELFAQAIHNECRPSGPFIAINCAAMPRNLIESELFGYEGGTFTGAERNGRPGKIELANGGTLFLDEIGDMPFELQAVLLRVLEDKQVMRLGGQKYIKVDFRVIAATNQDLLKLVFEKRFRQDLYYRLSVLKIELPPLRQRESDLLLLCKFFIDNYCQKRGEIPPTLSSLVQKRILEYDWPGNVRQLENAMICAVNTTQGPTIELEHLPREIVKDNSNHLSEQTAATNNVTPSKVINMKDAEIIAITNAITRSGKNVALAADLLGIGKSTLYRKLKQYNLNHLL